MHKKVWKLAGPILLANVTVPLLGAVDIAVVGHLPGPQYMAAVGIGATIFSALYFGFVFLRMGTTGLAAISYGADDIIQSTAWLLRALFLGVVIGALLWLLRDLISALCFYLIDPPGQSYQLGQEYFGVRIMSAPAALANFAILGWMIGMHQANRALVVQLILNTINIILDLYFVLSLDLGVKGAAYATVIAEYSGLVVGLILCRSYLKNYFAKATWSELIHLEKVQDLMRINSHILLRSLCLQVAFFYFTVVAATFGDTILAVNAVLMNFQLFMAYALDGFANASEALAGEAVGKGHKTYFYKTVKYTGFWALVFALMFTITYGIFWQPIVHLLTDVEIVREHAAHYVLWAILLPLVSVWSFHLDGIFTGATVTKPMRDSMFISLMIFIAANLIFTPMYQNHGLWLAFFIFMIARAITLGMAWPKLLTKF